MGVASSMRIIIAVLCCFLLVGCIGSNTQVSTDKITHYRENEVDSVQIESPSKQAQKQ